MKPEETVMSYWRSWTEYNLDAVLILLASDFVSSTPLKQDINKENFIKGFKMFEKTFSDLNHEITNIVANGDMVACEVVQTATFTNPLELPTGTIPPTNKSYKLPFAQFFRISPQGQISEQRQYFDVNYWFQQIGMNPTVIIKNKK